MSAASFADSANAAAPLARLSGSFGAVETIRRSSDTGAANPFYLDKPVTDCDHVTLELSVTERSGWCGANYYIYVRDAAGDWHHTGVFRLREENVNGQPYTYEIDLDKRETFTAIALWPADKGVDCIGDFYFSVYVDPACVTEYSNAIPKPYYQDGNVSYEPIEIHFATTPYGEQECSLNGLFGWLVLAAGRQSSASTPSGWESSIWRESPSGRKSPSGRESAAPAGRSCSAAFRELNSLESIILPTC